MAGTIVSEGRCEVRNRIREVEAAVERQIEGLRLLADEVPDARRSGAAWVSSVASRMTSVELEELQATCEARHDDPRTVCAHPCFMAAKESIRLDRDYAVATLVPGSIQEEPGWEQQMRDDALPEAVIVECRRALAALGERERRRRFDTDPGRVACIERRAWV